MGERTQLKLVGALLFGGLVVQQLANIGHPGLNDDDYGEVFAEYADSGSWIAVHFIQYAGVLLFLGGLLVLYRLLKERGVGSILAGLGAGAAIAAAGGWAALQAVDGVAQKYVDEAWIAASGAEKVARYADAQAVRWLEYGLNAYSHLLLGLAVAIFGIVIARTDLVARWLGWAGAIGGFAYMAGGVAVAYAGFESGFESAMGIVGEIGFVIFALGLLLTRARTKDTTAAQAA